MLARLSRKWGGVLRTWCAMAILGGIGFAQAQTPAKILVLTSHEGGTDFPNATRSDGVTASDNLAKAFGWVPPGAPAPNPLLITPAPTVDYRYGLMSIRASEPTDSGYVAGQTVRVTDQVNGPATIPLPGTSVNDAAHLLQLDTFKPAGGGRYDIVVVGTTYYRALQQNYDLLKQVMQDPDLKPNAMLFFVDSCCDSGSPEPVPAINATTNMARFIGDILNPAVVSVLPVPPPPATAGSITLGGTYGDAINANASPLNPNSIYKDSFTSLSVIEGGWFRGLKGADTNNNLFTVSRTLEGGPEQAYGVFFPGSQVFSGQGTCLFAVVDITPFDGAHFSKNTTNGKNIGQAFVNAALAGGSCGGNASIKADPASKNVSLAQPNATITLTITNENKSSSITSGRVEAALPAHLKFAGNMGGTCLAAPAVHSQGTPTEGAFTVTGIAIPFQGTCTITLPVQWQDTTDIATNSCIKTASQSAQLRVRPGTSLEFSTAQGQTNDIAESTVLCSAPELVISSTGLPPGPLQAGATVGYDITIQNLSETAAATDVMLTDFLPAGATLVSVAQSGGTSNPPVCSPATSCNIGSLPASGSGNNSATYTVQFIVPASQAAVTATPATALLGALPLTEVTQVNNQVPVTSTAQKTLTVQAQMNHVGNEDLAAFAGVSVPYSVASCAPNPASGSAPVNIDQAGAAQAHTAPAGLHCDVSFDPAPLLAKLPQGYTLNAMAVSDTSDPTTGAQTVTAIWTVTPPVAAAVAGTILGAPAQQLQALAGSSIPYALNCTPSAAIVPTGSLTAAADGALTAAPASHLVPAASNCSLAIDPAALPKAPAGYQWDAPLITQQGNNFVVTLRLSSPQTAATPVPGLNAFALLALSALLLCWGAAAQKRQHANASDKPYKNR